MERPTGAVLALLVAAIVGIPAISALTGAEVGAYRMFTRPHRARLEIVREHADGRVEVRPEWLAPHLSRDARRVIGPAFRGTFGEVAIDSIESSTHELGTLVCELDRDALAVEVVVWRTRAERAPPGERRERVRCAR